ncbi:MAG: hypothetical protein JNL96_09980 [Planctomycetaceae bacterium]|nr:hypothetical protein [Planctomycetaceae bacterium]
MPRDRSEIRHRILGTMYTTTTYGMWLRGDARGYVQDGRTYPANLAVEAMDRARLQHPPFEFNSWDCHSVGEWIGRALCERLALKLLALTVRTWHIHFVVAETTVAPPTISKCVKDTVRFHLKPSRPIWSDGYDKRFCFDEAALQARIAYVEQHNIEDGQEPKPWEFLR